MAKTRIFVSSTYKDLKHLRAHLRVFIETFGYEPIMFEDGDINLPSGTSLDVSCRSEVRTCHMLILMIAGSYGSPTSDSKVDQETKTQYTQYTSITKAEFEEALKKNLPIYVFVENKVLGEHETFQKNRANKDIVYAHADSTNVFELLDYIYAHNDNIYVKGFTNFEDISNWLRNQWSGLMAEYLTFKTQKHELQEINDSVNLLTSITKNLQQYSTAILEKVDPKKVKEVEDTIETREIADFKLHLEGSKMRKVFRGFGSKETVDEMFDNFVNSKNFEEFVRSQVGDSGVKILQPQPVWEEMERNFKGLRKWYFEERHGATTAKLK